MPRRRRCPDSPATTVHPTRPRASNRAGGLLRVRLSALRFALCTWLRFKRRCAPPGYLRLLRLPVENATRNSGADPPAGRGAGGARSP